MMLEQESAKESQLDTTCTLILISIRGSPCSTTELSMLKMSSLVVGS